MRNNIPSPFRDDTKPSRAWNERLGAPGLAIFETEVWNPLRERFSSNALRTLERPSNAIRTRTQVWKTARPGAPTTSFPFRHARKNFLRHHCGRLVILSTLRLV